MSQSTTINDYGFTPFANGGCLSLLQLQQEWVQTLYWWMSKSTTVNKNGFKPHANGGCQSLLESTRMGSHPLLILNVKAANTLHICEMNL